MRLFSNIALLATALFVSSNCRSSEAVGAPETVPAPAVAVEPAPQATSGSVDWPRFRGPDGNGISPEKGISKDWAAQPPRLLWKVPMSDDGYTGPSVANGLVYIIDHQGSDDIVRALSLSDGRDVWTYRYRDADSSNYGFARATPTVDGSKVYTLSRLGALHCLDAKTGKVVWRRQINDEFSARKPQWDTSYSPVVDGDRLIVCPGGPDAAVAVLDKSTGKTIWQGGGSDGQSYATPVVATIGGKKQYVVFAAKALIGVDASNGTLLWRAPWSTAYDVNAATPVVIGDSVFIASGYGKGCALVDVKGSEASIRWANKSIQAHFSSPIYFKGHIYGTGDPGVLVCLDPQTGKELWRQPGFEKGGIVGVDGVILALSGSNGDLAMVEMSPAGYKELGRVTPLGGQSWTAPIVAQGRAIVRNKSAIACLSLK